MDGSDMEHMEALRKVRTLAWEFANKYPQRDLAREFPYDEVMSVRNAGLMGLTVPSSHGGLGLPFDSVICCITELAAANPSLAQVMFVHWNSVMGVAEFASDEQRDWLYREVVENGSFLGNAASEKSSKNIFAWETTFSRNEASDGFLLNGRKFFATGSKAADYFWVMANLDGTVGMAIIPKNAPGLFVHDDWDAMGQRGTASSSVTFDNVPVDRGMMLGKIDLGETDLTSPLGLFLQTGFTAIYIGTAKGALAQAVSYVKNKTRPWFESGVETAIQDPYILQSIGHMSAYLAGAEAQLLSSAKMVRDYVAIRGRGERDDVIAHRASVAVAVAQSKLVATEVALRVCQDIFQVCGARATLASEGMDRYWRDVRTLTLHDPKDYKAKLIGEYLLQGKAPSGAGGIS